LLGDVLVTPEELGALIVETLVSSGPPTAPTRFSTWLRTHGRSFGLSYSSEIERHWR
jgi:hypothetical protein